MHSGRAHSLLLPVCGILICPFYFFSFISVSKNSLLLYWCTVWFAPEIDWLIETPHIHTTRRIIAWWHIYNFQLSVRSTVSTQMWQLTNQHRIMIQNLKQEANYLSQWTYFCTGKLSSFISLPHTHTHTHTQTHTRRVWKSVYKAPIECKSIPGNRSLCPVRHSVSKSNDSVANNRQISRAADGSSETHEILLNSNMRRRLPFLSVPL
jgi:hypothetical protein